MLNEIFCDICDNEIEDIKKGCKHCKLVKCDHCSEDKPRAYFSNYTDDEIQNLFIIWCDDCLRKGY